MCFNLQEWHLLLQNLSRKLTLEGLGQDMDVECVNYTFGGRGGFPKIRAQVIGPRIGFTYIGVQG